MESVIFFGGCSFQNRPVLVAMTFVFAAGVATVILPLVLGVSLLRQFFLGQHSLVYVIGGALMLGLGLYTLAGGKMQLPSPGHRAGSKTGPLGVYFLGLFSGVASSCCAPVLAGVIALSSVMPTLGLALGLGATYVFGMVAPLFLIALLWARYDWRRLLRAGTLTWRIGPLRRTIPAAMLASGLLLVAMGIGTIWIGLTYDAMSPSSYWAIAVALNLQEAGQAITESLAWLPNWLTAAVLLIGAALLWRRARSQIRGGGDRAPPELPSPQGKSEGGSPT
ncbi:MAG: cytochrome c biogenesis protein CcdA [Rhizobiales bacterium]|nr:cytochrome c biogenesis protein CcdA [Hyphomicrobiales bacterium]